MIRLVLFIASLGLTFGATYFATKRTEPLPILAEVSVCTPAVTIGYILINPDGYVGSIDRLSPAAVDAYRVLRDAGKMRAGVLRFGARATCPGV